MQTMIDPKFKPGEVVILKSGGPEMTVREMFFESQGIMVCCDWFDNHSSAQANNFRESQLKKRRLYHLFW